MQIDPVSEPSLRIFVRHGGYINPDTHSRSGENDSVAIVPPRRYAVERLLQMGRTCRCIVNWSKFNPEADREVAELVKLYGQVSTSTRALNDVASNRVREVSMASTATSEGRSHVSKGENVMVKEDTSHPNEDNYVKTDPGFANFLKKHSSPTHQRVTAGGRIVPMERAAPPKFPINLASSGANATSRTKIDDLTKGRQSGFQYGVYKPLDAIGGDPRFGGYQGMIGSNTAPESLTSKPQPPLGYIPGMANMPDMTFPSYNPLPTVNPSFQPQGTFGNFTWIPNGIMGNAPPSLQSPAQILPAASLLSTVPRIPLGTAARSNGTALSTATSPELFSPLGLTPAATPNSAFPAPHQPTPTNFVSPLLPSAPSMGFQNPLTSLPTALNPSGPPAYPPAYSSFNGHQGNYEKTTGSVPVDNLTSIKCLEDAETFLERKKQELQSFNREVAQFELQHRIVITAEDFPRHQEVVRRRHEELQHEISTAQKAKQYFERLTENHASALIEKLAQHEQAAENHSPADSNCQPTPPRSHLNVEAAAFTPMSPITTPKGDWNASPQSHLKKPTDKQTRTPLLPIQPKASHTTRSNSSIERSCAEISAEHVQHENGSKRSSAHTYTYQDFVCLGGTAFDGTNQLLASERTKSFGRQEDVHVLSPPPDGKSSAYQARSRYALEGKVTEAREHSHSKHRLERAPRIWESDTTAEQWIKDARKQLQERRSNPEDQSQKSDNVDHRQFQDKSGRSDRLLHEEKDDDVAQSSHCDKMQSQKRFESCQDQVLDALRQDPGVRTLVKVWNSDKFKEVIGIGMQEPKTDKEWELLNDSERGYWIRHPDPIFVKQGAAEPDRHDVENECDDYSKQSVPSSGTMMSDESSHNQIQAERQRISKSGWKDSASDADPVWSDKFDRDFKNIRHDNTCPSHRFLNYAGPKDPAWLDAWIQDISVEDFLRKKLEAKQAVAQASISTQFKEPPGDHENEIGENISVAVVQRLAAQGHVEPVSGAAEALGVVMGSQNTGSPTRNRHIRRIYPDTHGQQLPGPADQREKSCLEDTNNEAAQVEAGATGSAHEAAVDITRDWDPDNPKNYERYLECLQVPQPKELKPANSPSCQGLDDGRAGPKDDANRGSPFKRWKSSPFRR